MSDCCLTPNQQCCSYRVNNVRHTSGYYFLSKTGSSIKRKYCRNDQTNDNRFLNIIDVNTTIQVRRVLWSGFYHTGSLLKQYKKELYFVRWFKHFRHYKDFDKKIPGCMTYVVHPVAATLLIWRQTTITHSLEFSKKKLSGKNIRIYRDCICIYSLKPE